MRARIVLLALALLLTLGTRPATPHAFLDHASPAVGSALATAPAAVTLWFTQDLEPAFSSLTVTDQNGRRVDLGNAHVPSGQPTLLQIGLRLLVPGTYTVNWHVVSVDTHSTEGSFTFRVGG